MVIANELEMFEKDLKKFNEKLKKELTGEDKVKLEFINKNIEDDSNQELKNSALCVLCFAKILWDTNYMPLCGLSFFHSAFEYVLQKGKKFDGVMVFLTYCQLNHSNLDDDGKKFMKIIFNEFDKLNLKLFTDRVFASLIDPKPNPEKPAIAAWVLRYGARNMVGSPFMWEKSEGMCLAYLWAGLIQKETCLDSLKGEYKLFIPEGMDFLKTYNTLCQYCEQYGYKMGEEISSGDKNFILKKICNPSKKNRFESSTFFKSE